MVIAYYTIVIDLCLQQCIYRRKLLHSNLVIQLLVHLVGTSGFELGPHFCQLPVAEEVQPDRNNCPAVLTVVWMALDSNYTRQTSNRLYLHKVSY